MGKFDGVLICTDLDGTLYRADKTISRENRDAISYFKSEGGLFTFITGRMPYYSMGAYRDVSPNVPFGCINGGGLYDGERGEYVRKTELSREALLLVEYIDKLFPTVGIQTCCFGNTFFAKENPTMKKFRAATGLPRLIKDYLDVDEPIAKMIFGSDSNEDILAIEAALKSHPVSEKFNFIRSERTLFEILPKGVHKGLALRWLTEYLGIGSEKTVAIGDYNNDIGMFREAGLGIAVSNASLEALAAADLVTVSNEEHAIAEIIYGIESGKYKI